MRWRAFTLVELMVVVGIVALLATVLLPMANRAYGLARRITLRADLEILTNAIDAYQHDFGDIPRPDKLTANPFQGSVILTWALVAPGPAVYAGRSAQGFKGDGADGFGFRVRGTTGAVLGPYIPDGHFRFGDLTDASCPIRVVPPLDGVYDDSATFLGDREGNAILYFPRKLKVAISSMDTYFGALSSAPAYVANDNDPGSAVMGQGHPTAPIGRSGSGNLWALHEFQLQMPGVVPDSSGNPTLPDPSRATRLQYLLWGAGPDGRFCTDDDVTNFRN